MKIVIDRTHCDLCESYCDRHLAKLIRFPEHEDRPCIKALEYDGQPELTLVIEDGDHKATLQLTDLAREVLGQEGVSAYLQSISGPAANTLRPAGPGWMPDRPRGNYRELR
jgi:hypothetical protein